MVPSIEAPLDSINDSVKTIHVHTIDESDLLVLGLFLIQHNWTKQQIHGSKGIVLVKNIRIQILFQINPSKEPAVF